MLYAMFERKNRQLKNKRNLTYLVYAGMITAPTHEEAAKLLPVGCYMEGPFKSETDLNAFVKCWSVT